jgi:hypothetical protein
MKRKRFYVPKIGDKFGRWEIIDCSIVYKNNVRYVLCKCLCEYNTIKLVRLKRIYNNTSSCRKCSQAKHGKCRSRIYHIWCNMIQRCYNPNNQCYYNYGARGINVCDDWKNNFTIFYKWALSHGYLDDLVIDRIDNELNYTSANCRWITDQQSSFNIRGKFTKNKTSKYKGVSFKKKLGKWIAQISKDGQKYHIGCFVQQKDAAIAYNNKAEELFGIYAYLNKVE